MNQTVEDPNSSSSLSKNIPSPSAPAGPLCASCDRCRARKTKCDGKRPCGNCAAKFMKQNKLKSIEGIDIKLFNCVYSPAKRRGPVPGRVLQARNKMLENQSSQAANNIGFSGIRTDPTSGDGICVPVSNGSVASATSGGNSTHLFPSEQAGMLQQLENQKQNISAFLMNNKSGTSFTGSNEDALMAQQRQIMLQAQSLNHFNLGNLGTIGDPSVMGLFSASGAGGGSLGNGGVFSANKAVGGDIAGNQQAQAQAQAQAQTQTQGLFVPQQHFQRNQGIDASRLQTNEPGKIPTDQRNQRMKVEPKQIMDDVQPEHVNKYSPLLRLDDPDGNMLRSYYMMSINELFCLPSTPTDEDYFARISISQTSPRIPHAEVAALKAARFSEIALGAQANNQIDLSLELSNATVLCLRECVEQPVHSDCIYDITKAYFLHAVVRSLRGDFLRYFKYRRICLTYIKQLSNTPEVDSLMAALAFHDSWVYMMYNASEQDLPDINGSFPSLEESNALSASTKYGVCSDPTSIASNPCNNMWIQGIPPVFINNDAPPLARSLDALASAIRSCCEHANDQFALMLENKNSDSSIPSNGVVKSYNDEFCSRNMVISSHTLLQAHEATTKSFRKHYGYQLMISAMDAFLEDGEDGTDGFTDTQIQSLLLVCNLTIERPIILFSGGPIYHVVTNAAIMLCHILNALHSNLLKKGSAFDVMERALYEEILDTYISIRKLLNMHRRKLPIQLRCHSLPRANLSQKGNAEGAVLIDLNETLMCKCKGCQGFVLKSCSPCVALERAQRAQMKKDYIIARENNGKAKNEAGRSLQLGEDAELDEALLSVLAELISTK